MCRAQAAARSAGLKNGHYKEKRKDPTLTIREWGTRRSKAGGASPSPTGENGGFADKYRKKGSGEMRVVSVNVGMPREVEWHGKMVSTGIYKEAVKGRVALRKLNLDGDGQADLSVHGGEYKAVYCCPIEHYGYWKKELPGQELTMGNFGENFTTEGLLEDSVNLGDRWTIGSAEMVVTQPRLPCYKLGIRFGSDGMVKRFLDSRRTGFYLAVLREGEVCGGDEIAVIARDANAVTISEITRLYIAKRYSEEDGASVRRALLVGALPESWKEYFRERLGKSLKVKSAEEMD
jgi:MOSC domain-containing protein YiiM